MPHIKINGREVAAGAGTTLLTAARALDIDIPVLCMYPDLEHVTSCMLCVVEDVRSGELLPACSTPARAGMEIATAGPKVFAARQAALALLLGDHLGDCEGPCRRACPAGMDIPAMLRLIAAGRPLDALRVVRRDIILPAVLGRICPAPCEKVCRRSRHDAPVAICLLKRHAGDMGLDGAAPPDAPPAPPGDKRVAVVGAGPAGLSAAHALRQAGHAVVLFEKDARPGGQLRNPDLAGKLPAAVLAAETDWVLAAGIVFESGVVLGRDVSLAQLRVDFDAVILATGAADPATAGALFGLRVHADGIEVERPGWRTSLEGVFACGNAVKPGRMAVRALAQGRAAAAAADRFLRGAPEEPSRRVYDHRIAGRLDPSEIAAGLAYAVADARLDPAAGVAGGYNEIEARREAARCLHCDCRKARDCKLRLYADRYDAGRHIWKPEQRRRLEILRYGELLHEPGKCIACGICVRLMEKAGASRGLTFIGRGLDVRVGPPLGDDLAGLPRSLAAECAAACPTGALCLPAIKHGRESENRRKEADNHHGSKSARPAAGRELMD